MRFLCLAAAAAASLLFALPAQAASPQRGRTYSGGSADINGLALSVSADGKRIYDVVGTEIGVTCASGEGVTDSAASFDDDGVAETFPIKRGGSFRIQLGEESDIDVTGRFASGGKVNVKVAYASREGCSGSASVSATVQPRQAGANRRLFALSRETPFAAFDLPGSAIGLADFTSQGSTSSSTLDRVDSRGRASRLGTLDSGEIGDAARLTDGSVVFTDSRDNCVRRRDTNGKVTTAVGTCSGETPGTVVKPGAIAAVPGGGFVFADGGSNDDPSAAQAATRVRRVASNGQITPVLAAPEIGALAVERDGSVLATTQNHIVRVTPAGQATTVAGGAVARYGGDGGKAIAATMAPGAVAALPRGGFLFVDESIDRIRQVSASGQISTFAGGGEISTGVAGTKVNLVQPGILDVLSNGDVVVGDQAGTAIIPAKNGRLLVGLPERAGRYAALARAHRALPVALTKRARVKLVVKRGRKTVASITRTLPAGTHGVPVPRSARTRGKGSLRLSVRASAAGAKASDSLFLG